MYEIILGRNQSDRKKLGLTGTIFLGKHYVTMEQTKALANPIHLDVNKPHVILVSGKRGSGKSYSLGVIAEGIANLPKQISKNLTCFIFDTMGIYWTMKYPNYRDDKLLQDWKLKPASLDPIIYVPIGLFDEYQKKGIPVDKPFAIRPYDVDIEEWCEIFQIDLLSSEGLLFDSVLETVWKESMRIKDILDELKLRVKSDPTEVKILANRIRAAQRWGIFSDDAEPLDNLLVGGKTIVLDLSAYALKDGGERIKALVIGFIAKKSLQSRLMARKAEEVKIIHDGGFDTKTKINTPKAPMLWILIDEAHEFLPKEGKTLATYPLVQLLREGRQPGISLVLATQQPGKIHTDVLTQSDIVLSHRLTAKLDVEALNAIMQSYLAMDIQRYIDGLPRVKGAAIVLDDANEKIYPLRVRPRFSWHGGEDPTAIREKIDEILTENQTTKELLV